MAYDLLIRNGRVIDGSGTPAFRADVGVRNGKIAEIGKLRGSAARSIDADGLVVSPGFINSHCHYDAQLTWDPLCTYSCYHGATSMVIGNCSLAVAPIRPGTEERLMGYLSYVEAIPMETLRTVKVTWESIPEYMAMIDKCVGVNVGMLIGHTAVRHYVMREESQGRAATRKEIDAMCEIVRGGMKAGALGLSINRSKGHFDPHGVLIPSTWAQEDELFALADVLAELGTGIIQSGAGRQAETKNGLMTRLAEASGRQVLYNTLAHLGREPQAYKQLMALVDKTVNAGIRAIPMCNPNIGVHRFTMRNTQEFKGVPTWHPILVAPDEEKKRAYRDPEVRRKLHEEVIEWKAEMPGTQIGPKWPDNMWVTKPVLPKNQDLKGKTIRQLAEMQGKGIIDALLDLALEEDLNTVFSHTSVGHDLEATAEILTYRNTVIGLSDAGAHVQFHGGTGYSSRFLGYWVREQGIMSLEEGVKKLTFDNASAFEIYDRGLLRPGLAADIAIFNPDTINLLPEEEVYDLPGGAWRLRELATGVHYTIVNGQVLIEDGKHTGALPGHVLRNSLYQQSVPA